VLLASASGHSRRASSSSASALSNVGIGFDERGTELTLHGSF
jgi:hypothetical protein